MGWRELKMMNIKKYTAYLFAVLAVGGIWGACSISYKLEGGSINYDMTKTILISEFPNRTPNYPLLTQVFDLALRKRFIEQTRLKETGNNADIEIEGEITGYQLTGQAVKEDDYASKTRLTVSIRVRYINHKEAGKDVDQSFSAFREFDSSSPLESVESQLIEEIVNEIVDMIYNATVANW
ncbi:MAG: LPS assembly lipoprotein LptE [Dysgonamonadaceae bacterium]|jgi:hypothetical protein|nr:LPS assembly lipoprotein LptE [Dysgonamonadaceae bacterium]